MFISERENGPTGNEYPQLAKPNDFSPSEAIELKNLDETRALNRRLWILRGAGLLMLAGGWFAVAFPDFGKASFLTDTFTFALLGVLAFAAAIQARKVAVHLEKKLRLRLLVHNMELEHLAMRDELTQLFNRRYLFDRLDRELAAAKSLDHPLALIVANVNSLKEVNSTHGHQKGDLLLATVGRLLLEHSRATDIPARIAGGEFAVLLPNTNKAGAATIVERLSRGLEEAAIDDHGSTLRISASFGISGYPWGAATVDGLVQQASDAVCAQRPGEKRARRNGSSKARNGAADPGSVPAALERSLEVRVDREVPQ